MTDLSSRAAVAPCEQYFPAPRFFVFRLATALATASTALCVPGAEARPAPSVRAFAVPAGSLAEALQRLALQADIQILFPYEPAARIRSPGLRGRASPRAAVARLLRHSGLEIASDNGRTIILRVAPPQRTRPARGAPPPSRPVQPPTAAPPIAPPPPPPHDILVTGRAAETRLRDSQLSYAVTRIDAAALNEKAPLSTADLFKQVPGFWVESTGGQASNNVRARGIPTDGYSSVALLEDGLPIQYDGGLGYLNTDQIYRIDQSVARAEAVRGGPSAIFIANAPGGSLNFISKNGLDNPGGTLAVETGSFGLARIDGYVGGKVAPGLGLALGGFTRTDSGPRDPGYPADVGGQLHFGLDWRRGGTRLSLRITRLDDRVILYLPVPLRLDADGRIAAAPGFDPLTDTLAGPDTAHLSFKTASGPYPFDLTQGTHSRITFVTLSARTPLGDAALETRLRLRTGETLRNALFPTSQPMTRAAYLESVTPQLGAAFPTAATTTIRYADTGAPFSADANGNGLVVAANLMSVRLPMTEAIGDTRLTRAFAWKGHHEAAIGVSFAATDMRFDRFTSTALLDVRGQARRLDVLALDSAGRVVGALTDGGILRYGAVVDAVAMHERAAALYAADEWQIARRLRLDLGARWDHVVLYGEAATMAPVDLGDATTLADDAVLGPTGAVRTGRHRYSGLNATAGVNFEANRRLGLFARLTRSMRLPAASAFNADPARTDQAGVPITMAEAGLIAAWPRWSLSAVGFATYFSRLPFTDYRFDLASNSYIERTSIADTATTGLELSGKVRIAGPLSLSFQAVWQNPRYRHFRYTTLIDDQPVVADATGHQLIRVPRLSLRAEPSLSLFGGRLRLGIEAVHYSGRFADIANNQRLPAYDLLNANMTAQLSPRLSLALHGANLTNSLGLTEGNPRVGSFDTGATTSGYFLARPEFGRSLRATLRYAY